MAGVVLASIVVLLASAISGVVLASRPTQAQAASPRVTGTAQRASINASAQTLNASATSKSSAARL
jgi:hypothetical protein